MRIRRKSPGNPTSPFLHRCITLPRFVRTIKSPVSKRYSKLVQVQISPESKHNHHIPSNCPWTRISALHVTAGTANPLGWLKRRVRDTGEADAAGFALGSAVLVATGSRVWEVSQHSRGGDQKWQADSGEPQGHGGGRDDDEEAEGDGDGQLRVNLASIIELEL